MAIRSKIVTNTDFDLQFAEYLEVLRGESSNGRVGTSKLNSFYVLAERVYKLTTVNPGKFEARYSAHARHTLSGPFSTKAKAEMAALASLKSQTCLDIRVIKTADFRTYLRSCASPSDTEHIRTLFHGAIAMELAEIKQSSQEIEEFED
jgi:hypothetical protein